MRLKKIVILFIAACSWLGILAQTNYLGLFSQRAPRSPIPNWTYHTLKPYHFGFVLGANQMGFSVAMRDNFVTDTLFGVQSRGTIGFTVGALFNKSLHDFWNFRTGTTFSFGTRRLTYSLQEIPGKITQMTKSIESVTMDIPLEIKWTGMPDRGVRPFVIGGFRYSLDMANARRRREQPSDHLADIVVRLERDDFLFTVGAGFDFYLPLGNRIGIEIKMAFGLRDMLFRENNVFTNGIERLTSRNLQIAINIE
ncbi:MAG: PorT family protein [Bacteroidales bacterium]|nr:PorT family protein [Bacteroidales bacterium]